MISLSLFNILMYLIVIVTALGLLGVWAPEFFFNETGVKLFLTFGVAIVSIVVSMGAIKMFGPEVQRPSVQQEQGDISPGAKD